MRRLAPPGLVEESQERAGLVSVARLRVQRLLKRGAGHRLLVAAKVEEPELHEGVGALCGARALIEYQRL